MAAYRSGGKAGLVPHIYLFLPGIGELRPIKPKHFVLVADRAIELADRREIIGVNILSARPYSAPSEHVYDEVAADQDEVIYDEVAEDEYESLGSRGYLGGAAAGRRVTEGRRFRICRVPALRRSRVLGFRNVDKSLQPRELLLFIAISRSDHNQMMELESAFVTGRAGVDDPWRRDFRMRGMRAPDQPDIGRAGYNERSLEEGAHEAVVQTKAERREQDAAAVPCRLVT